MVLTIKLIKKFVVVAVLLGLSACVSIDPYTQPSETTAKPSAPVVDVGGQEDEKVTAPQPEPTVKPKEVSAVAAAPTVVSNLLGKAKKQQRQGDLNTAMSTVERAIRIAPRYPTSYYQLAQLKFDANDFSNAKSLAQKSISLGASGSLKRSAQELVAMSDSYIGQGL